MEIEYHKGFIVIKSGKKGPIFVAPHSTLSYRASEREDVGSENIAFVGVQKLGGSAIISTVPRLGLLGIDYNRKPPPKVMATTNTRDSNESMDYFKKFAWTADDEAQSKIKKKIHRDFWKTATKLASDEKPFYVFCHTLSSSPKNLPVVIDIITGRGKWIDKNKIESIVTNLNQKYNLDEYKQDVKEHIYFWILLFNNYVKQNFGSFDKVSGILRNWMDDDLKKIKKTLNESITVEQLTPEKYRELAAKMIEKVKLQLTVESIYHGDYAKPVKPLLKKTNGIAIEVETFSYFSEIQPELVVDIISDIIENYK